MGLRIMMFVCLLGGCSGTASADSPPPLWSYHNGNTLTGHNLDYQSGYIIGVIDGYLAAHQRLMAARDASATWLDNCISSGWPAPWLAARLHKEFARAYRHYKQPAAQTLLQYLGELCAREER